MEVVSKTKGTEVEEQNPELCAIPKTFATQKVNEIVADHTKKAILEEYFMWMNILNSPVQVNNQDENEEVNPE